MQAVVYPTFFKMLATVDLPGSMRGESNTPKTPLLKRLLQLYLPVNIEYLEGVQTPDVVGASVNVIPLCPSMSMLGVEMLPRGE